MSPLDYSRDRLRTFLGEIRRLKDSDFPHQHPRQVLERIEDIIQTRWDALAKLTPANDPAVVHVACSESLSQLFTYLPLLGFVLRSTNVRNSFEIYGPLLRMARSILGAGSKLVLSSEWSFSPFVYRPITDLPNVVLIGLPASEADNPLLTPLAGHELGHSIWQQKQIGTKYDAILQNEILAATKARWSDFCQIYGFPGSTPFSADLFVLRKAAYAQAWAMKQVEESFCDVLGVRIFGESYLYAFAYLLSPGAAGFRSAAYPNMARRTANLAKAAADFGVSESVP